MKKIIAILFVLITQGAVCQNKIITDNITNLKELTITGGSPNVKIGTLVINNTLETKLYFISATQVKDTDNLYITKFYFGHREKNPVFGPDILFKFNEPVISVTSRPHANAETTADYALSEANTVYRFTASEIKKSPFEDVIIEFVVKSKTKIKAKVFGIDGLISTE